MLKHLLAMLLTLMLCTLPALAEEAAYAPLPLGGPAPYTAVPGALSEDGLSYDDGTMKVWIELGEAEGVTVYYVYVTIQDPSQLRTATAGNPRSKTTLPVYAMAEQNNAVLAFNGDYYNYHDQLNVAEFVGSLENERLKALVFEIVDDDLIEDKIDNRVFTDAINRIKNGSK